MTTIAVSAILLLAAGCGREIPEIRQYEEVSFSTRAPSSHAGHDQATPPAMPTAPAVGGEMTWTTPEGWEERPGKGMRVATFTVTQDDQPLECTLVALGPNAGGLEANIRRWMGQVEIQAEDAAFARFVENLSTFKTAGGHPGTLIDLGQLLPDDASTATSMLAAIVRRGRQTIFVKMTGSRAGLQAQRERFVALSESLK